MTTAYAAPLPGQMATEALTGTSRGLRRIFGDYLLYRRTLSELRALSPRERADLGISRFDLARIARASVRGN